VLAIKTRLFLFCQQELHEEKERAKEETEDLHQEMEDQRYQLMELVEQVRSSYTKEHRVLRAELRSFKSSEIGFTSIKLSLSSSLLTTIWQLQITGLLSS
jgi:hypothetical protein